MLLLHYKHSKMLVLCQKQKTEVQHYGLFSSNRIHFAIIIFFSVFYSCPNNIRVFTQLFRSWQHWKNRSAVQQLNWAMSQCWHTTLIFLWKKSKPDLNTATPQHLRAAHSWIVAFGPFLSQCNGNDITGLYASKFNWKLNRKDHGPASPSSMSGIWQLHNAHSAMLTCFLPMQGVCGFFCAMSMGFPCKNVTLHWLINPLYFKQVWSSPYLKAGSGGKMSAP